MISQRMIEEGARALADRVGKGTPDAFRGASEAVLRAALLGRPDPAPVTHLVGGIKIKELDWTEYEGGLRSRRFGLDYFIMPSTMIEKYRVNLANEYTDYAPTIEDAKKIAQDDFERIVKKVVKEDTPAPETRERGTP